MGNGPQGLSQRHRFTGDLSRGLSSVRNNLFLAPSDMKEECGPAAPFLHPCLHLGHWDDLFLGLSGLGLLQQQPRKLCHS